MSRTALHPRPRHLRVILAASVAALVAVGGLLPAATAPEATAAAPTTQWVSGWNASPMGMGTATPDRAGFTNTSFRNIVRMGASGPRIRVRISNVWGNRPLVVNTASVAVRVTGAEIKADTKRKLAFGGQPTVTVPVGQEIFSDPVNFPVRPSQVLAVSLHTPGPTGTPTWHQQAMATSYISKGTNRANQNTAGGWSTTSSWHFISGIDVLSSENNGTIVAIGDSITDGVSSLPNTNTRYPDYLSRRMQAQPLGKRYTVANAGIGGNRLLTDSFGTQRRHERAGNRLTRDVFRQSGVSGFVILLGTNDLARYGGDSDGTKATLADFQRAYGIIAQRADDAGLPMVVGTIPPAGGPGDDPIRLQVNAWLRRSTQFDGLADFDAVLRDPKAPGQMRADLVSPDTIHPNSKGYNVMANAVPIQVFTGR